MIRIKRILCPIDFSEMSRHAFDRAVGIGRCYGATISILHVLPAPSAVPAILYGPEGPGPFGFQTVDRELARAEIPKFLGLDVGLAGAVDYYVLEGQSVHKEILVQTERLEADLVVIGTHGRSGFDRLFLGSVAEKILRTSEVPVMVVPPHAHDAAPIGREPFQSIVLATDFSVGSEAALRYAASLAQHGDARLTIVHVVEPIPVGHDPLVGGSFDIIGYRAQLERDAMTTLKKVIPDWVRLGCETEEVVLTGKPSRQILSLAEDRRADLIVLGVHGRNALDRLLFGSTAEQLVRRATCPVLAVRQG